jgi:Na+:H+ antiporter, NhaA family
MLGRTPLRRSWISSERHIPRLIARPIRTFLDTESAGGIVLLAAAGIAIIWANSPWSGSYESLWHTEIGFTIGSFEISEDLLHWVNDGLMAIFFFVVGLEIKRELVAGELNEWRKAALPAVAALGGMVVPALFYTALNVGGTGSSGWGIPMATDIAFAVGVLTLFGSRAPTSLKIFLLSLAIVDDIGAILVIALFYSSGLQFWWLGAAVGFIVLVALMKRFRVWWTPIYAIVGAAVWFATLESGVHATIAGVVLGLMTPARPYDPSGAADAIREAEHLIADPSPGAVRRMMIQAQEVVSVAERLEHVLHPYSSFLIIPVFALANAGVQMDVETLGDAVSSPITVGVVLGLVVGKLIGITGFSWIAVRSGIGTLPEGATWGQLAAVAAIAGIGFTVSLFIAGLAFRQMDLVDEAKIGILAASAVAAAVGAVILRMARGRASPPADTQSRSESVSP